MQKVVLALLSCFVGLALSEVYFEERFHGQYTMKANSLHNISALGINISIAIAYRSYDGMKLLFCFSMYETLYFHRIQSQLSRIGTWSFMFHLPISPCCRNAVRQNTAPNPTTTGFHWTLAYSVFGPVWYFDVPVEMSCHSSPANNYISIIVAPVSVLQSMKRT